MEERFKYPIKAANTRYTSRYSDSRESLVGRDRPMKRRFSMKELMGNEYIIYRKRIPRRSQNYYDRNRYTTEIESISRASSSTHQANVKRKSFKPGWEFVKQYTGYSPAEHKHGNTKDDDVIKINVNDYATLLRLKHLTRNLPRDESGKKKKYKFHVRFDDNVLDEDFIRMKHSKDDPRYKRTFKPRVESSPGLSSGEINPSTRTYQDSSKRRKAKEGVNPVIASRLSKKSDETSRRHDIEMKERLVKQKFKEKFDDLKSKEYERKAQRSNSKKLNKGEGDREQVGGGETTGEGTDTTSTKEPISPELSSSESSTSTVYTSTSRLSSQPRLKPLKLVKDKLYPVSPASTVSLSPIFGSLIVSSSSLSTKRTLSSVTLKTDSSTDKVDKKSSRKPKVYLDQECLSSETYDESIYSSKTLNKISLTSYSSSISSDYKTSSSEVDLEKVFSEKSSETESSSSSETEESSSESEDKSDEEKSSPKIQPSSPSLFSSSTDISHAYSSESAAIGPVKRKTTKKSKLEAEEAQFEEKKDLFEESSSIEENKMQMVDALTNEYWEWINVKMKVEKDQREEESSTTTSLGSVHHLKKYYYYAVEDNYDYDVKSVSTTTDNHTAINNYMNVDDSQQVRLNMALNLTEVLKKKNTIESSDDDMVQILYRNKFLPKPKLKVINQNTVIKPKFKIKELDEQQKETTTGEKPLTKTLEKYMGPNNELEMLKAIKGAKRKLNKPTRKAFKGQIKLCGFLKLFEEEISSSSEKGEVKYVDYKHLRFPISRLGNMKRKTQIKVTLSNPWQKLFSFLYKTLPPTFTLERMKILGSSEEVFPYKWTAGKLVCRPRTKGLKDFPYAEYCLIPIIASTWNEQINEIYSLKKSQFPLWNATIPRKDRKINIKDYVCKQFQAYLLMKNVTWYHHAQKAEDDSRDTFPMPDERAILKYQKYYESKAHEVFNIVPKSLHNYFKPHWRSRRFVRRALDSVTDDLMFETYMAVILNKSLRRSHSSRELNYMKWAYSDPYRHLLGKYKKLAKDIFFRDDTPEFSPIESAEECDNKGGTEEYIKPEPRIKVSKNMYYSLLYFDEESSDFSITPTMVTSTEESSTEESYFKDIPSKTTICSTSTPSLDGTSMLKIGYFKYESDKDYNFDEDRDEESPPEKLSEKLSNADLSNTTSLKSLDIKPAYFLYDEYNADVSYSSEMDKEIHKDSKLSIIESSSSIEKKYVNLDNKEMIPYDSRFHDFPISNKLRYVIGKKEMMKKRKIVKGRMEPKKEITVEKLSKGKKIKKKSGGVRKQKEQSVYKIALLRRLTTAIRNIVRQGLEMKLQKWYLFEKPYSDYIFDMFDIFDEIIEKYKGTDAHIWVEILEYFALEKLSTKGPITEKYFWLINELLKFRDVLNVPEFTLTSQLMDAICCDGQQPRSTIIKTITDMHLEPIKIKPVVPVTQEYEVDTYIFPLNISRDITANLNYPPFRQPSYIKYMYAAEHILPTSRKIPFWETWRLYCMCTPITVEGRHPSRCRCTLCEVKYLYVQKLKYKYRPKYYTKPKFFKKLLRKLCRLNKQVCQKQIDEPPPAILNKILLQSKIEKRNVRPVKLKKKKFIKLKPPRGSKKSLSKREKGKRKRIVKQHAVLSDFPAPISFEVPTKNNKRAAKPIPPPIVPPHEPVLCELEGKFCQICEETKQMRQRGFKEQKLHICGHIECFKYPKMAREKVDLLTLLRLEYLKREAEKQKKQHGFRYQAIRQLVHQKIFRGKRRSNKEARIIHKKRLRDLQTRASHLLLRSGMKVKEFAVYNKRKLRIPVYGHKTLMSYRCHVQFDRPVTYEIPHLVKKEEISRTKTTGDELIPAMARVKESSIVKKKTPRRRRLLDNYELFIHCPFFFHKELGRAKPCDDLEVMRNNLAHKYEQHHMRTQVYYRRFTNERMETLRYSEILPTKFDFNRSFKGNKEIYLENQDIFEEAEHDSISEDINVLTYPLICAEHERYQKHREINHACKEFANLFLDAGGDLDAIKAKLYKKLDTLKRDVYDEMKLYIQTRQFGDTLASVSCPRGKTFKHRKWISSNIVAEASHHNKRLYLFDNFYCQARKGIPRYTIQYTKKEKVLLKQCQNFMFKYRKLHPDRILPLLIVHNEYGIQRCICTMLKPVQLIYHKLPTWEQIGLFISDYIQCIPFFSFTSLPHVIRSPQLILQTRKGNPLDLAMLCASLLLGAGYNAYVVVGYAHREITNMQTNHRSLPYLDEIFESIRKETREEPNDYPNWDQELDNESDMSILSTWVEDDIVHFNYEPRLKRLIGVPKSKLHKTKMKERQRLQEIKISEAVAEKIKFFTHLANDPVPDPMATKRLHAWVLIRMETKSDFVEDEFFLEPSTGWSYSIFDDRYTKIEYMWNHENFWANMHPSMEDNMDRQFDVTNMEKWMPFISGIPKNRREYELVLGKKLPLKRGGRSIRRSSVMRIPRKSYLDMCNTWIRRIPMTVKEFNHPWPKYYKKELYRRCCVIRRSKPACNGLWRAVIIYEDYQRTIPLIYIGFYKDRCDRLVKRYIDFHFSQFIEIFEVGRVDCLKRIEGYIEESGFYSNRTLDYREDMRKDCLSRIKLHENCIIMEFIEGRRDFLRKCEAYYGECMQDETEKLHSLPSIRKHIIAIKECRYPDPSTKSSIAEVYYDSIYDNLEVYYHKNGQIVPEYEEEFTSLFGPYLQSLQNKQSRRSSINGAPPTHHKPCGLKFDALEKMSKESTLPVSSDTSSARFHSSYETDHEALAIRYANSYIVPLHHAALSCFNREIYQWEVNPLIAAKERFRKFPLTEEYDTGKSPYLMKAIVKMPIQPFSIKPPRIRDITSPNENLNNKTGKKKYRNYNPDFSVNIINSLNKGMEIEEYSFSSWDLTERDSINYPTKGDSLVLKRTESDPLLQYYYTVQRLCVKRSVEMINRKKSPLEEAATVDHEAHLQELRHMQHKRLQLAQEKNKYLIYPIKYRLFSPSKSKIRRDIIFYFGLNYRNVYTDFPTSVLTNRRPASVYSKTLAKNLRTVMEQAFRELRRFNFKTIKHIFLTTIEKALKHIGCIRTYPLALSILKIMRIFGNRVRWVPHVLEIQDIFEIYHMSEKELAEDATIISKVLREVLPRAVSEQWRSIPYDFVMFGPTDEYWNLYKHKRNSIRKLLSERSKEDPYLADYSECDLHEKRTICMVPDKNLKKSQNRDPQAYRQLADDFLSHYMKYTLKQVARLGGYLTKDTLQEIFDNLTMFLRLKKRMLNNDEIMIVIEKIVWKKREEFSVRNLTTSICQEFENPDFKLTSSVIPILHSQIYNQHVMDNGVFNKKFILYVLNQLAKKLRHSITQDKIELLIIIIYKKLTKVRAARSRKEMFNLLYEMQEDIVEQKQTIKRFKAIIKRRMLSKLYEVDTRLLERILKEMMSIYSYTERLMTQTELLTLIKENLRPMDVQWRRSMGRLLYAIRAAIWKFMRFRGSDHELLLKDAQKFNMLCLVTIVQWYMREKNQPFVDILCLKLLYQKIRKRLLASPRSLGMSELACYLLEVEKETGRTFIPKKYSSIPSKNRPKECDAVEKIQKKRKKARTLICFINFVKERINTKGPDIYYRFLRRVLTQIQEYLAKYLTFPKKKHLKYIVNHNWYHHQRLKQVYYPGTENILLKRGKPGLNKRMYRLIEILKQRDKKFQQEQSIVLFHKIIPPYIKYEPGGSQILYTEIAETKKKKKLKDHVLLPLKSKMRSVIKYTIVKTKNIVKKNMPRLFSRIASIESSETISTLTDHEGDKVPEKQEDDEKDEFKADQEVQEVEEDKTIQKRSRGLKAISDLVRISVIKEAKPVEESIEPPVIGEKKSYYEMSVKTEDLSVDLPDSPCGQFLKSVVILEDDQGEYLIKEDESSDSGLFKVCTHSASESENSTPTTNKMFPGFCEETISSPIRKKGRKQIPQFVPINKLDDLYKIHFLKPKMLLDEMEKTLWRKKRRICGDRLKIPTLTEYLKEMCKERDERLKNKSLSRPSEFREIKERILSSLCEEDLESGLNGLLKSVEEPNIVSQTCYGATQKLFPLERDVYTPKDTSCSLEESSTLTRLEYKSYINVFDEDGLNVVHLNSIESLSSEKIDWDMMIADNSQFQFNSDVDIENLLKDMINIISTKVYPRTRLSIDKESEESVGNAKDVDHDDDDDYDDFDIEEEDDEEEEEVEEEERQEGEGITEFSSTSQLFDLMDILKLNMALKDQTSDIFYCSDDDSDYSEMISQEEVNFLIDIQFFDILHQLFIYDKKPVKCGKDCLDPEYARISYPIAKLLLTEERIMEMLEEMQHIRDPREILKTFEENVDELLEFSVPSIHVRKSEDEDSRPISYYGEVDEEGLEEEEVEEEEVEEEEEEAEELGDEEESPVDVASQVEPAYSDSQIDAISTDFSDSDMDIASGDKVRRHSSDTDDLDDLDSNDSDIALPPDIDYVDIDDDVDVDNDQMMEEATETEKAETELGRGEESDEFSKPTEIPGEKESVEEVQVVEELNFEEIKAARLKSQQMKAERKQTTADDNEEKKPEETVKKAATRKPKEMQSYLIRLQAVMERLYLAQHEVYKTPRRRLTDVELIYPNLYTHLRQSRPCKTSRKECKYSYRCMNSGPEEINEALSEAMEDLSTLPEVDLEDYLKDECSLDPDMAITHSSEEEFVEDIQEFIRIKPSLNYLSRDMLEDILGIRKFKQQDSDEVTETEEELEKINDALNNVFKYDFQEYYHYQMHRVSSTDSDNKSLQSYLEKYNLIQNCRKKSLKNLKKFNVMISTDLQDNESLPEVYLPGVPEDVPDDEEMVKFFAEWPKGFQLEQPKLDSSSETSGKSEEEELPIETVIKKQPSEEISKISVSESEDYYFKPLSPKIDDTDYSTKSKDSEEPFTYCDYFDTHLNLYDKIISLKIQDDEIVNYLMDLKLYKKIPNQIAENMWRRIFYSAENKPLPLGLPDFLERGKIREVAKLYHLKPLRIDRMYTPECWYHIKNNFGRLPTGNGHPFSNKIIKLKKPKKIKLNKERFLALYNKWIQKCRERKRETPVKASTKKQPLSYEITTTGLPDPDRVVPPGQSEWFRWTKVANENTELETVRPVKLWKYEPTDDYVETYDDNLVTIKKWDPENLLFQSSISSFHLSSSAEDSFLNDNFMLDDYPNINFKIFYSNLVDGGIETNKFKLTHRCYLINNMKKMAMLVRHYEDEVALILSKRLVTKNKEQIGDDLEDQQSITSDIDCHCFIKTTSDKAIDWESDALIPKTRQDSLRRKSIKLRDLVHKIPGPTISKREQVSSSRSTSEDLFTGKKSLEKEDRRHGHKKHTKKKEQDKNEPLFCIESKTYTVLQKLNRPLYRILRKKITRLPNILKYRKWSFKDRTLYKCPDVLRLGFMKSMKKQKMLTAKQKREKAAAMSNTSKKSKSVECAKEKRKVKFIFKIPTRKRNRALKGKQAAEQVNKRMQDARIDVLKGKVKINLNFPREQLFEYCKYNPNEIQRIMKYLLEIWYREHVILYMQKRLQKTGRFKSLKSSPTHTIIKINDPHFFKTLAKGVFATLNNMVSFAHTSWLSQRLDDKELRKKLGAIKSDTDERYISDIVLKSIIVNRYNVQCFRDHMKRFYLEILNLYLDLMQFFKKRGPSRRRLERRKQTFICWSLGLRKMTDGGTIKQKLKKSMNANENMDHGRKPSGTSKKISLPDIERSSVPMKAGKQNNVNEEKNFQSYQQ